LIEKDQLGDWSPSQNSNLIDDLFQSRYVTAGFKTIFLEMKWVSTRDIYPYLGEELFLMKYSVSKETVALCGRESETL